MKNNFECIYMDMGGYCVNTYEFVNGKIKCKLLCNRCEECFNRCEMCICPKIFKEKDYCKECKNKGE